MGLRGGGKPGLGSLEGPGLSLSAEGTECGASACTDYPSPRMVRFAQLTLQVLPKMRKAVPVSRLLHSRLAAARSRARERCGLPRKSPRSWAGWEGPGAGAGPGKVKVMSRFRQQHALALVPRARDPAYVCTWVSWMSPATSRLLMAGRFFRRW